MENKTSKRILLIGSGGREHAIALALSRSPRLDKLYVSPGNPGTQTIGESVELSMANNFDAVVAFVKQHAIDITIVGPEQPLVDGIVDRFLAEDLVIIGPSKDAAQLEGSKSFAKSFMKKYNIPTANYAVFDDHNSAKHYVQEQGCPIVIKADGLASGKGVVVAHDEHIAMGALESIFVHNKFSSNRVVIETFLEGVEASLMAFVDGNHIVHMVSAQDHKPIYDGDKGPNTGGMGCFSPSMALNPLVESYVLESIVNPTLYGIQSEGMDFRGILYFGLMIQPNNRASVVEYNTRFGDPEAQVVLNRLDTDLITICEAIHERTLHDLDIRWDVKQAVCVVLTSSGYPNHYDVGVPIHGTEIFETTDSYTLIHAGTRMNGDTLVTNGGRVLGVLAKSWDISSAAELAYNAITHIQYSGMYYRKDIGLQPKAL
ncbi:phosphoribosylamine--glycine ligase [bacterium]|jgi:phosphoribosylamine---glycine ligase|nr:phosphoribosylamine--glycine ligase [bacterium]|tara:strand:- start:1278 stop:2567 length:1290 start_codon:yes stop_codon:yes gene_type:complete